MTDILYITFNRLAYTRKTLPAMIENAGADFMLTIVDNGSRDGTVEYLQVARKKYGRFIKTIIFNRENQGIAQPTNEFWKQSKATFLGKVDNDTLVPPGWLARLLDAHHKADTLGVIGGFHFHKDYVNQEALERRVMNINGVSLIPDSHIGGCCYLLRRSVQQRLGSLIPLGTKTHGWTWYQHALCQLGYYNGYLYPLLMVDHFDDPLSEHNLAFTEHAEMLKISLGEKFIPMDREAMRAWYQKDLHRVESGASLLACLKGSLHKR